MKRIFSWLLALSLLCSMFLIVPAGCAEGGDETASFDAKITNSFGRQESEWMESNITRATLFYSLLFDLNISTDEDDIMADFLKFSYYVGKDGTTLITYFPREKNDLMILYYPTIKSAYYFVLDKASDLALNMLLPEMCKDGYYPIHLKDVKTAISIIDNHVKTTFTIEKTQ